MIEYRRCREFTLTRAFDLRRPLRWWMRDSPAYLTLKRWRLLSSQWFIERGTQEATTSKEKKKKGKGIEKIRANAPLAPLANPREQDEADISAFATQRARSNLRFSARIYGSLSYTREPLLSLPTPVTLARSARRHARRFAGIRHRSNVHTLRARRESDGKTGSERQGWALCVPETPNWSANGMWNARSSSR